MSYWSGGIRKGWRVKIDPNVLKRPMMSRMGVPNSTPLKDARGEVLDGPYPLGNAEYVDVMWEGATIKASLPLSLLAQA